MTKILLIMVLSIVLGSVMCACHGAEQSAGMALDSAASVIRSGDEKIWIAPEATPSHPSADKY